MCAGLKPKKAVRMLYLDSVAKNVLAERPVAHLVTDKVLADILFRTLCVKRMLSNIAMMQMDNYGEVGSRTW